ncbi:glycerophosphodiester phosphodiesterase domain-containing protein 5-like [Anneissia japonica]|uniref:glycerophosphodiester phosphodiesterase domain-containing protein 5-like n=1 Tax=Anneissia japonica TaxID=1529436 RepID=UPI00142553C6|nr:glycerophosphodiester phosphodiesterase domain-containing protein 5-like [Anneissia japonica]XP_033117903.1 glycerophosphodiester phosphodiesterase domain-containing protein 5-like [Anneissia japonica]XP_033117904.1 glycerophosphodiester phosphodiesterase domain-containing protein 5-like [Anneissia japonica]XP_033117905.1 glycerophosphodiester phosphodiesterase domain-containing protein 5-like [Anneissia japonica]
MVSHIKLENQQKYKNHVCLSCITGLYGCRWKRYRRSTEPTTLLEKISLFIVFIAFLLMSTLFYFWIVAGNDADDVNWIIWTNLQSWFNWYLLLFALTAVAFSYISFLIVLGIFHWLLGQQFHLHLIHKILVVAVIGGGIAAVIVISLEWRNEWELLNKSLQISAPILQLVAVVLLTLLTWPFAKIFFKSSTEYQIPQFVLYLIVMTFIYLSPLLVDNPCFITSGDLPVRPKIMAHRGLQQLAPENTMIAFEQAVNYSVFGFESDVSISWDGEPFLMHDANLARTTNVKQKFPAREWDPASTFNLTDLQKLDAGSWFIERDPFRTVKSIPEHIKNEFHKQRIPTLKDLLNLAILYNKSVIFDIREPDENHPYYSTWIEVVVNTTLETGIRQEKIWWLSDTNRSWVEKRAPGFIQTAESYKYSIEEMRERNIRQVNAAFYEVTDQEIRDLKNASINSSVYMVNKWWLFSVYWCVGAHSVTSGAAQVLENRNSPAWYLDPSIYLIIWTTVDGVSVLCVIIIFIIQRLQNPSRIADQETVAINMQRKRYSSGKAPDDTNPLYDAQGNSPAGNSNRLPPPTPVATDGDQTILVENQVVEQGSYNEVKLEM